jgi:bifunctional DNase/RNase
MKGKTVFIVILLPVLVVAFSLFEGCSTGRKMITDELPTTEVQVKEVMLDPDSMMPVVILQDLSENISLPIWIGSNEALAIATPLENVSFRRPMTHDLLNNILNEMHTTVIKVVVTELRGNTFYANIYLQYRGKNLTIDSRPSDAIALAIRAQAPIFVSTQLLQSRGIKKGIEHL